MTTQAQDRAFAELAYTDFANNSIGKSINNSTLVIANLPPSVQSTINDSLSNWTIIDVSSPTTSGFYGVAFKNEATNEIKFAFRGTDPNLNGIVDAVADAQIIAGVAGLPLQFGDAKNFVASVLAGQTYTQEYAQSHLSELVASQNVSFTGHSLGGGIAEYMTAITNGGSVTFNAPGIEQFLSGAFSQNTVALGDPNDIVFNMGTHTGTVMSLTQNVDTSGVNWDIVEEFAKVILINGDPNFSLDTGIGLLYAGTLMMDQTTLNYIQGAFFQRHSMEETFDTQGITEGSYNTEPAVAGVIKVLADAVQMVIQANPSIWGNVASASALLTVIEGGVPSLLALNSGELPNGWADSMTDYLWGSGNTLSGFPADWQGLLPELKSYLDTKPTILTDYMQSGSSVMEGFSANWQGMMPELESYQDAHPEAAEQIMSYVWGNTDTPPVIEGFPSDWQGLLPELKTQISNNPTTLMDYAMNNSGFLNTSEYKQYLVNQALAELPTGTRIEIMKQLLGAVDPWDEPAEAIIEEIQPIFQDAEITRSPLVIDLDGDGVETLGKASGTHFDLDNNGFAEQTGWASADDGMLVRDLNGNEVIDSGAEIFGNNTVLPNGQKATNGFEALASLDSNQDGVVDANDNEFASLRVWKDANQNGITDAGELIGLADAGITSFNTGYTSGNATDAQGNPHLQMGSYTNTTGQTQSMDDVWFAVDTARTEEKNLVAVSDEVAALPEISGFGNVHSLHQAMARDATGELEGLVQSWIAETNPEQRANLVTDIIDHWAGVQDVDPNSRISPFGLTVDISEGKLKEKMHANHKGKVIYQLGILLQGHIFA